MIMYHDYATILLKQYANVTSERTAAHAMKALDRAILQLFPSESRELVQQLIPGMTRRRLGARFGVRRPVPVGDERSYTDVLTGIRRELNLTDESEAAMYLDAYFKSHISLMTMGTRLQFASVCDGDTLRAYLRAVDSLERS